MTDSDAPFTRSDVQLVRRAARQRWPVTRALRRQLVGRLEELSRSDNKRLALGAVKALVDIDRLNLAHDALTAKLPPLVVDATSTPTDDADRHQLSPSAFAEFMADVERIKGAAPALPSQTD